ncbi:MAG: phosphoribosyltransferase family protein [Synergistaceae bacterium]|jgi:hypothetical protein|nr:phosphoribosyltransferase family protein [Synergistaceae bacterium]
MRPHLQIALRDSTTATRSYVIVNPLLAKHLPSVPSVTLEYFRQLGDAVAATCKGERVLAIGFAETATAVGAAVAHAIEGAVYVHTTRETWALPLDGTAPEERLVTEFLEEHSHARNQALYLREELYDLSKYDRLVFVEDEITTGKTIRNFLRNVAYRGKITVSALVFNGFDESAFAEYDANFCCLQKVGYVRRLEFAGLPNPRSGIEIDLYHDKCAELAGEIAAAVSMSDIKDKDVLVLGTEEFMYPALILGREFEKTARGVKSHSTTRTPLLPQGGADYPLHSRQSFPSPYEDERVTYLYNLASYDTVIIITDAPGSRGEELIGAVQSRACVNIYFVRIRSAS